MKQLIVLMGVLPILLICMLQIGLDQRNSQITSIIQACVYSAKEEAKQDGYFTAENCENIKNNISKLTGISKDKIHIETENKKKYRYKSGEDKIIRYRVEVQIDNLLAASRVYGISDKENSYKYVIDSYTASEYI